MQDLRSISSRFAIQGRFEDAQPHGHGHIHDTYLVTCRDGERPIRTILQRINHDVFTDPPRLMDNLLRVTGHLRRRLQAEGVSDLPRRVLTVVQTRDGAWCHRDPDGHHWRALEFIPDTVTVETPQSVDPIYQAARAFGRFDALLSDLPGPPLQETIPGFHNGVGRYRALEAAVGKDACNRAALASREIAFVQGHADILEAPSRLAGQGRIPIRVTHNDTKINNVLLDRATGEGLCVIDLDTVMPGLALYDVGDLIRTACSTASEDEPDLAKVELRPDRFEAVVLGFLTGAGTSLHPSEIERLVLGGQFMTLIIGARFLTDFLQGDTYFKVHRPNHNLDRCRVQFRLAQTLIEQQDRLQQIVRREAGS